MTNIRRIRITALVTMVIILVSAAVVYSSGLSPGMSGASVRRLQQDLAFLGYLHCLPTGYYGPQTKTAVMAFQKASGLAADGIAGPKTLSVLAQKVREKNASLTSRRDDTVGLLPWEDVNRLFPRGSTARVWDVKTEKGFVVWRLQGTYHADVEPLTKADTAVLLAACGGRWTKDRLPALVELQGRLVAASMYPFPHGHEAIHDNGFNGQFCLHFLGSRVHASGRSDPTHQEAILFAAQANIAWRNTTETVPPPPTPTPNDSQMPLGDQPGGDPPLDR